MGSAKGGTMYFSQRALWVRNGAAACVNGAITLVILLIAPLGLAAVIINTILVMVSTLVMGVAMDRVVVWLLQGQAPPYSVDMRQQQELERLRYLVEEELLPRRDRPQ